VLQAGKLWPCISVMAAEPEPIDSPAFILTWYFVNQTNLLNARIDVMPYRFLKKYIYKQI
jgi:hypothetical protein